MIENLKNINDRDIKLAKFKDDDLNQMYLRVFSSNDGELILQDLANRCFVYDETEDPRDEGMRSVWLSIQSRLRGAVNPEVKDAE